MFKVKVFTMGKCKEKWLELALKEYEKRLEKEMKIEWVLLADEAALEKALLKEKKWVALSLDGALMSSEDLSLKLYRDFGSHISFAIGGSSGFSKEILSHASFLWSLSPLTFTHQMARLILAEQLYRAIQIEKNTGYHK